MCIGVMVQPFEGARRNWKFVLSFIVISLLFWAAEFAYQFYVLVPEEFVPSLVRAHALSGATFIGLALLSSIVMRFKPHYAKYWYVRRSLGVMGVVFLLMHIGSVINFYWSGDTGRLITAFSSIENPIIWGEIGIALLFLLAISSTDWTVQKLTFPKWKTLHRLVYFGYMAGIFHFLTINPPLLQNPAGYLLLLVTLMALAGELYWMVKYSSTQQFKNLGFKIGLGIIALYLMLGYIFF